MKALPVVVTPELWGRALTEPSAMAVLSAWRSGTIVPVMHRSLLKAYLQVLRALGVEDERWLRAWTWIGSRHESVVWDGRPFEETLSGWPLCLALARRHGATVLVSDRWKGGEKGAPETADVPWGEVAAFLKRHESEAQEA